MAAPYSNPAMRGLLAGIESTSARGTEVNATVKLGGLTDIRPGLPYDVQQVPELDGSMSVARDTAEILGKSARIVATVYATFEDLPYWLQMAYATAATSSGDGGSPPMFSRTYAAGLSALNDPGTLTLEYFTNSEEWVGTYGMLERFTMRAPKRGWTMLEATIILKDLTQAAKTAGISSRTGFNRLKGGSWAWTFDTSSAIGTTAVTDCIEEAVLDSGPLYAPIICQDGTLFLAGHQQLMVQPVLTLTMKRGSQAIGALYTAYAAGSLCRVRGINTGTVIHDAVTRKVTLDHTGNILAHPELAGAENEGSITGPWAITGAEDSATSRVIHFTVQSAVSSLVSGV